MTNDSDISQRFRHKAPPAVASATHKFRVGVSVVHKFGLRSDVGSFRVVRHLPDGGAGLQYRLKSDRNGQERVAIESALERAPGGDFAS